MGITVNTSPQQITASVGETQIDVAVSGGFGPSGNAGAPGQAASVTVGTVTTGAAGSQASVTNVGTSSAAVLNFTIPAGATGATGPQGPAGAAGASAWADITGKPSFAAVATSGAYSDLTGRPTLGTAAAAATADFAAASHTQAWTTITGTPTTLAGYGITDAVASNDARLTDARTPTSHSHGSITNAGAIGSTSGLVVTTGASDVLGTLAQGTAGQVLKVNGTATGVEWGAAAADVSIDATAADVLSASSGSITADDPGADRLVFWDDSASKLTHLTVGSGLTISGTTMTAAVTPTVASPSQITSNQNDYAGATGDINRISSDAARDITGIAAGTGGQAILLVNVGSFAITLKHQSTSSTAANRIVVPWGNDYSIPANGSATLIYDDTTGRWRVL